MKEFPESKKRLYGGWRCFDQFKGGFVLGGKGGPQEPF